MYCEEIKEIANEHNQDSQKVSVSTQYLLNSNIDETKNLEQFKKEHDYFEFIDLTTIKIHPHMKDLTSNTQVDLQVLRDDYDLSQFSDKAFGLLQYLIPIIVVKKGNNIQLIGGLSTFIFLKSMGYKKKCSVLVVNKIKSNDLRALILLDKHFLWLFKRMGNISVREFIIQNQHLIDNDKWSLLVNELAPQMSKNQSSIAQFLSVSKSYVSQIIKKMAKIND